MLEKEATGDVHCMPPKTTKFEDRRSFQTSPRQTGTSSRETRCRETGRRRPDSRSLRCSSSSAAAGGTAAGTRARRTRAVFGRRTPRRRPRACRGPRAGPRPRGDAATDPVPPSSRPSRPLDYLAREHFTILNFKTLPGWSLFRNRRGRVEATLPKSSCLPSPSKLAKTPSDHRRIPRSSPRGRARFL